MTRWGAWRRRLRRERDVRSARRRLVALEAFWAAQLEVVPLVDRSLVVLRSPRQVSEVAFAAFYRQVLRTGRHVGAVTLPLDFRVEALSPEHLADLGLVVQAQALPVEAGGAYA